MGPNGPGVKFSKRYPPLQMASKCFQSSLKVLRTAFVRQIAKVYGPLVIEWAELPKGDLIMVQTKVPLP